MRICPLQLGFHPDNRNGQPPNGARCSDLLRRILQIGYDTNTADADGVVVAEAPGSTIFFDFNRRATAGDELLAPVLTGTLAYATLSHSHLNQIFKNISLQTMSDVKEICSADGRLSLQLLHEKDAAFAKAAKEGLLWEVLDHAIMSEEPDCCTVIQAASNAQHGLAMVTHEMQTIAALCRVCRTSSAVAGRVSFQTAQERLSLMSPECAEQADLKDLFRFVVDVGGGEARFIEDLQAFHSKFVDPKVRVHCRM